MCAAKPLSEWRNFTAEKMIDKTDTVVASVKITFSISCFQCLAIGLIPWHTINFTHGSAKRNKNLLFSFELSQKA